MPFKQERNKKFQNLKPEVKITIIGYKNVRIHLKALVGLVILFSSLGCVQTWSDVNQAGINFTAFAIDTLASVWAGRPQSSTVAWWELTWCPSWPLKNRITSTVGAVSTCGDEKSMWLFNVNSIPRFPLQATTRNTSGLVWMTRLLRMISTGLMATHWWGGMVEKSKTVHQSRKYLNRFIIEKSEIKTKHLMHLITVFLSN